ncbi:hypothetical protein KFE98_15675 [bacterium SCSIO 12741]|nr:hypothetical protein KFE98_15675 [bacterium SCSIO 12741]
MDSNNLTPFERNVLRLLLSGYSLDRAAKILDATTTSVELTKDSIREKWLVETDLQLFREAIHRGFLMMDYEKSVQVELWEEEAVIQLPRQIRSVRLLLDRTATRDAS